MRRYTEFSPDGLFLYYLSDQQIESGADSPYGRGLHSSTSHLNLSHFGQ